MMNFFVRKSNGSVSIFLSMILLFTLSVVFILSEGVRQLAIKQETKIVSHASRDYLESIYLKDLWDEYGILSVDMSLGSNSNNLIGLEEKLMQFIQKNENPEIDNGTDFLRTTPASCSIDAYGVLTDNEGAPFIRLAAQKEFESIPMEAVDKLMDAVNEGKEGASAEDTLLNDIEKGEKALKDIEKIKETNANKSGKETNPSEIEKTEKNTSKYPEKDWADTEDPMKTAKNHKGKETLSLFIPEGKDVSNASISVDNMLEKRSISKGTIEADDPGIVNRVMFNEYLMDRLSSYSNEKETGTLKYELEYVLEGTGSDTENLKKVINKIMIFREAQNVTAIVADPVKNSDAGSLAVSIAGVSANPILIEAVKAGIIAGWAYVESVLDVRALMDGKKVPLLKNSTEWTSNLKSLPDLIQGRAQAKSVERGLSYDSYTRFLLYFKGQKWAAYRAMDIIEESLHEKKGFENIRMDRMLYACDVRIEYKADTIFPIYTDVPELVNGYAYQREEQMTYVR
jgi:hypothetical protein